MSIRVLKNLVFVTLPSILFCFVLCELFFRYVITACEAPYVYFDSFDQILRYDINDGKEGIYTIGKFAKGRAKWRINNYGWNSKIDYVPRLEKNKPLIAIIGDSYIEAFQVSVEDNIAAILQGLVKNEYDAYSFGMSGAPLSQYLQMSRYVNRHFGPEVIVFNIIHNDFDESIRDLNNKPYFLQIGYDSERFFELPIYPYKPNAIRRILGRSALIRYFYINLQITEIVTNLTNERRNSDFNANIDVNEAMGNCEIIKNSTFFLIRKIKEENPRKVLIFMIDAPRQDIYSGTIHNSNVLWLHRILEEACAQYNCHFIDLTVPFSKKFGETGVKFNSDYDYHWNELGHGLAARALYERLVALEY